jgi:hypothetical protein
MGGGERGGREGMRGDRRGGGADVNVRIGGGDRGYGRGGGGRAMIYGHRRPGYGVVVRGGGCRTVVVKKRVGYRVVIKKMRRCY